MKKSGNFTVDMSELLGIDYLLTLWRFGEQPPTKIVALTLPRNATQEDVIAGLWEISRLHRAKLIEETRRGTYRLTKSGHALAKEKSNGLSY